MTSRAQRKSGSSDPRSRINSTALRIGASGLRSSWDSIARNSSLRRSLSASCALAARQFGGPFLDSIFEFFVGLAQRIFGAFAFQGIADRAVQQGGVDAPLIR